MANETTPSQKHGDLLTDTELAAELQIEPRTLRLWRKTRGLPHLRLTPKIIRYRRKDVDGWLGKHRLAVG